MAIVSMMATQNGTRSRQRAVGEMVGTKGVRKLVHGRLVIYLEA